MEPNEPRGKIPDELLNDRIDAYLAGVMEPKESAEFEVRLAAEPELAMRVECLRAVLDDAADWCGEAPPGIERADTVRLPAEVAPVPFPPASPSPRRARWWPQAAAALLIFAAGIAVGSWGEGSDGSALPKSENLAREAPEPPAQTQPAETKPARDLPEGSTILALATSATVPHATPDLGDNRPELNAAPAPDTFAARLARVKPRLISQANGRMVVQTEIPNTGAQAIWIIDPAWNANREGEER